jgi:catechol 2,3-dioxygenase-like lactoylglutathione lyase family enzyme
MEVEGISIVAVPVDDIDEALNFFCGVLGMEKRKDLSGNEGRYIEVAPPGSPVALSPYTGYGQEPGKATIGEYSRIVLRVADVRAAYDELAAHGVRHSGPSRLAPAHHATTDALGASCLQKREDERLRAGAAGGRAS